MTTTPLSPRETEVHGLLLDGLTRWQIGEHLGISHKTVDVHISAVIRKRGFKRVHDLLAAEIRRLRDLVDARAA